MWLELGIIFALCAALASGVEKIFRRHVALKVDGMTYAFIFSLIGAIVMLPFYLKDFQIPSSQIAWVLLISSSLMWVGTNLFLFKGYQHLEASVAAPLSRVKILIFLALSIIFLHETLTAQKIVGTVVVFLGLIMLTGGNKSKPLNLKNPGIYYIILAVTFTSSGHILEKAGLVYLNPGIFAFASYFIPTLVFLPFFITKKVPMKKIYENSFWPLIMTGVLSAAFHYFILLAFTHSEASVVIPITELSSLIGVFGGIFFLGEKSHMVKKIVSTIIVIVGSILVTTS